MKRKFFTIFSVVAMLLTGTIFAQEQTGGFIGSVSMEDGSLLPGVTIEVRSESLIGVRAAISEENGTFRLPNLPPGKYDITFTLPAFKTYKREGIILEVGKTLKIDVVMQVGEISEDITVIGEAPLVDVRGSSTAANIPKELFTKLPHGRDYAAVIATQSGVLDENDAEGNQQFAGLSIDGASVLENSFYIDGMNNTNMHRGYQATNVNFDAVEEVQLKTTGYSAEYGGSMGGVISVITRSGGNKFHGTLGGYFTGSAINANDWDPLVADPADYAKRIYWPIKEDKQTDWQLNANIGGPIFKDRLWFFASLQPRVITTERPFYPVSPTTPHEHEGELTTAKSKYYSGTVKINGVLFKNMRFSLSGALDINKRDGSLPGRTGDTPWQPEIWDVYNWSTPQHTFAGQINYIIGNNLVITAYGGRFYENGYEIYEGERPETRLRFRSPNTHFDIPDEWKHGSGWSNASYSDIRAYETDIRTRTLAKTDITYYFSAGGEHALKAGFSGRHTGADRYQGQVRPYFSFYYAQPDGRYDTFELVGGETVPTPLGYVEASLTAYDMYVSQWDFSMYIQDQWTIRERLTINLGIRTESETIPSQAAKERGTQLMKWGFADKIQPRAGFSYDLFGDGRSKIFGSCGLYYDIMKTTILGALGVSKEWSAFYPITSLNPMDYYGQTDYLWTGSKDPLLGGEFLRFIDHWTSSTDLMQPNMKPMGKIEFVLGFERTLSENVVFTTRLLYNSLTNAIEDIGVRGDDGSYYFWIGNPGSDWINDRYKESTGIPDGFLCPDPKRKYYSVKFGLDKKYADKWFGGVTLTLSRLEGNYSGLADTNWTHGTPNVNKMYDCWFQHYDQDMNPVEGVLGTDRPIDLRAYGAYTFDFGLTVGANGVIRSGQPISRQQTLNEREGWNPLGLMTDGRYPVYWNIDLYAEQRVKISDGVSLSFDANVTNLTMTKIVTRKNDEWFEEKIEYSEDLMADGLDIVSVAADKGILVNPAFMKAINWKLPFQIRLGVKLIF